MSKLCTDIPPEFDIGTKVEIRYIDGYDVYRGLKVGTVGVVKEVLSVYDFKSKTIKNTTVIIDIGDGDANGYTINTRQLDIKE